MNYGPWHSERLVYRAVESEDDAFLNTVSSDAEAFMNAAPFLPVPQSKKSSIQYREFLEKALLSAIICLPPPGIGTGTNDDATTKPVPIGVIHLIAVDLRQLQHRRSEIGLDIVRQYQGQGFGTEAIKWALHWGFQYAALHRIEIGAFGYNERALKLYEKIGFVLEGRKRDFLWFNGKYYDLVTFSMLEDEWRERFGND